MPTLVGICPRYLSATGPGFTFGESLYRSFPTAAPTWSWSRARTPEGASCRRRWVGTHRPLISKRRLTGTEPVDAQSVRIAARRIASRTYLELARLAIKLTAAARISEPNR